MPETAKLKGERFEFRMTKVERSLFQRAAELEGKNLSEFVLESLRRSARQVLREHEVIVLTGQDRKDFVSALMNPPKLNARLRRAFQRHQEPVD